MITANEYLIELVMAAAQYTSEDLTDIAGNNLRDDEYDTAEDLVLSFIPSRFIKQFHTTIARLRVQYKLPDPMQEECDSMGIH